MEADLPLDRVTPYELAFTSVGVDYFGPFAVKSAGDEKKDTDASLHASQLEQYT